VGEEIGNVAKEFLTGMSGARRMKNALDWVGVRSRLSAVSRIMFYFLALQWLVTLTSFGQGFQNVNMDALRRNVVFLHIACDQLDTVPAGCVPGTLVPYGTGFLVSVPHKGGGEYIVLVTARHMVDPAWMNCEKKRPTELHAYFNKAKYDPSKDDEGTLDIPLSDEPDSWKFPDDESADVAVTRLNAAKIEALGVENQAVNIRDFPTEQEITQVKTGDQVISAGLLVGASGTKRNYPVFKFGYVSDIPGEKIAIPCCPTCAPSKYLSEWMIAASLVAGNSGAPIYFVPSVIPFGGSETNQRVLLLGVQSMTFLGSDVAGMTPAEYLINAIHKLNLDDADMTITGQPYKPDHTPAEAPSLAAKQ
jgi:hypothetical protein